MRHRVFAVGGIVALAALVLCAAGVFVWSRSSGMFLPAKETKLFDGNATLVNLQGMHLQVLRAARDSYWFTACLLPLQEKGRDGVLALCPSGGTAFVGDGGDLLVLDGRWSVLRRIKPEEFQLSSNNWTIAAMDVVEGNVCFVAETKENVSGEVKYSRVVVSWDPAQPPANRKATGLPHNAIRVHLTGFGRLAYVVGWTQVSVVDLKTMRSADTGWSGDWSGSSFHEKNGLLLLRWKSDGSYPEIHRARLEDGKLAFLTEGTCAVWGAEDWVYFTMGTSQLWRCRKDGGQSERVYNAPVSGRGKLGWLRGNVAPPVLLTASRDGSCLAFEYSSDKRDQMPDDFGVLLLDVQRKRYRVIPSLDSCGSAWLAQGPRP